MDPTCAQPNDPRWLEFCCALTPWALATSARTSLAQARTRPTRALALAAGMHAVTTSPTAWQGGKGIGGAPEVFVHLRGGLPDMSRGIVCSDAAASCSLHAHALFTSL